MLSEQAEAIADKFSKVSQEYEPLKDGDIDIPEFDEKSIPQFAPKDVQKKLEKVKTNKSVHPGDIKYNIKPYAEAPVRPA